jgi:hypothetical protein
MRTQGESGAAPCTSDSVDDGAAEVVDFNVMNAGGLARSLGARPKSACCGSGRRANASRPSTPRKTPVDHAKPAARSTAHSISTVPTTSAARTIGPYISGSIMGCSHVFLCSFEDYYASDFDRLRAASACAGCTAAACCAAGWAPGCKRPRRVVRFGWCAKITCDASVTL